MDVVQKPGELEGQGGIERESMAVQRCLTGMAAAMRLRIKCSNERKDANYARHLIRNWCTWDQAVWGRAVELLEPMAREARMAEGHIEGIPADGVQGLTTAFMDGLNRLFSVMKRRAPGIEQWDK